MTAAARASARLRADLLARHLRPGQQVRQEALAERYGVSRVPLREALTELAAEGLVVHEPNRGYFVTELSGDDMREVYRLREILEAEAIEQACTRLTDDDLRHLAVAADMVAAALDRGVVAEIAQTNRAFHFAVFEASGMPRLTRLLTSLWDTTDAYRGLYFSDSRHHRHIRREHRELLAALQRRDVHAAVAAQARHRDRSVHVVTAALASDAGIVGHAGASDDRHATDERTQTG